LRSHWKLPVLANKLNFFKTISIFYRSSLTRPLPFEKFLPTNQIEFGMILMINRFHVIRLLSDLTHILLQNNSDDSIKKNVNSSNLSKGHLTKNHLSKGHLTKYHPTKDRCLFSCHFGFDSKTIFCWQNNKLKIKIYILCNTLFLKIDSDMYCIPFANNFTENVIHCFNNNTNSSILRCKNT
jgi:hypothetical protein